MTEHFDPAGDGFRARVVQSVRRIQDHLCEAWTEFEREQGFEGGFVEDAWDREGGGGGLTRIIQDAAILEKGGVSFSEVHGELQPEFARRLPGNGTRFWASGVSLVWHPHSPHLPTVHANFRHIQQGDRAWFGGGADLTPYYYDEADAAHFHGVWRAVCERHSSVADYERFSNWCDRYFYLPHRSERRGVGGIFFDKLDVSGHDPGRRDAVLAFVEDAGRSVVDAYLPIARRHLETPIDDAQRRWQELRRGRYVEFNLVYDRGTVFGLKTGGRTESILMSLPARVRWGYCEEPEPGTPEYTLLEYMRRPLPPEAEGISV